MSLREDIILALGSNYKPVHNLIIERIEIYTDIFNKAAKDYKSEGYRRGTSVNYDPSIYIANQRYYMNIALTAMDNAAKQIRADFELLGLSEKGKKIEITSKVEKGLSILEQFKEFDQRNA